MPEPEKMFPAGPFAILSEMADRIDSALAGVEPNDEFIHELLEPLVVESLARETPSSLALLAVRFATAAIKLRVMLDKSHKLAQQQAGWIEELNDLSAQQEVLGDKETAARVAMAKIEAAKGARSAVARRGGRARANKSPVSKAMALAKEEFFRMLRGETKHTGDLSFARRMCAKYPDLRNENSVQNACTRWRREFRESSS